MNSQPSKLLGQPSTDIVGLCCKSVGSQETFYLLCTGGTQTLLIAKLRTVDASISTKDENCLSLEQHAAFYLRRGLFSFRMSAKERTLRLSLERSNQD